MKASREHSQRYSIRRAFSSLGCHELDLDDVLTLARRHGIDEVELRALGGTIDLAEYFSRRFKTPQALASHVAISGIRVVALDASCCLISDDDKEGRSELLALAPWADALGAGRIRVFDGGSTLDQGELDRAVANLEWWIQERAAHGWACDLMIETHDTLVTTPAILRFLNAAPNGTALLWDAFHTWVKGKELPVDTWDAIGEVTAHIHVKDGIIGSGAERTARHTLPRQGHFPMKALLDKLRSTEYAGPLSLEWGRKWHRYLPLLDEALETAEATRWW